MGCISSKEKGRSQNYAVPDDNGAFDDAKLQAKPQKATAAVAAPKKPVVVAKNVAEQRPRLDPKDFMFKDLKDQLMIKMPGSINGQAFMIDCCENCDLFILDHCAQVTVDDCKNCRIFIGPTDGSIFMRDCSACKVACLCRQLRTRDCVDINLSLFCRTRPVIETSRKMIFSCFDFEYRGLYGHLRAANLSCLTNFWSFIYDFNPAPGNHELAEPGTGTLDVLGALPDEVAQVMGSPGEEKPAADQVGLLTTWGERARHPDVADAFVFVVFPPARAVAVPSFLASAATQATILRTNHSPISAPLAASVAQLGGWPKTVAKALSASGLCCTVELAGAGAGRLVEVAKREGGFACASEDVATQLRHLGLE